MRKVGLYSLLLIAGLFVSLLVPALGAGSLGIFSWLARVAMMAALSFIMIQVGHEFDLDKQELRTYAFDCLVAMTAAAIPWLLCALYFVLAMAPMKAWANLALWKHALLLSCFAAPTSAGILFSMLAAAGLASTWAFSKARVLAIFDDVATLLFLVPLQMSMIGLKWQLAVMALAVPLMLWIAWCFLHTLRIPGTWPWILGYAGMLAIFCEGVDILGRAFDPHTPLRLEVLLPAFVLGCTLVRPHQEHAEGQKRRCAIENRVATLVTAVFMFLAGASVPLSSDTPGSGPSIEPNSAADVSDSQGTAVRTSSTRGPFWGRMALDVAALTLLSNVGKSFPALCYRREASAYERLALGVCMFPRGEVGTGVLVIALAYGIGGRALTAATLSLALNLVGTGLFILVVKHLLKGAGRPVQMAALQRANLVTNMDRPDK
ncbi:MAG TPA: hypothetical protein VKU02_18450 [Gemmataceae bacterium]|nr:hypothetical protein [Gemmataceae bacterium]